MTIKELREQRKKALDAARAIADTAERENRALTEEEQQNYDAAFADFEALTKRIERQEQLEQRTSELNESAEERIDPGDGGAPGEQRQDALDLDAVERGVVERLAQRGWQPEQAMAFLEQRSRHERYSAYDREARANPETNSDEYRRGFAGFLRSGIQALSRELRALQVDVDASGGALVAPMEFVRDLIKFVDDMVYLRQWGTVRTITAAQSVGYPSLDTDPSDADWTSELAVGNEDSAMAFGGRELHPHPLAKLIKLSAKLLRMDASAEGLVRERLGYKFGVTLEKAGLTGTGAQQPLGLFTASDQGISTGRDVATGNTSSTPTFDGLIEAKYTLKGAYWNRARWKFHRDVTKLIAKLKDNDGQYLWRESVRVGEPDRLLGLPAFMSEYAPNTISASQYVGILGDFSFYWWADALGMTVQRLNELYAATNQIGFIGRQETDGMPVLEEAFVRVQLGS